MDIASTIYKERALIVWVVASKERFFERPPGYFQESDSRELVSPARERRAVMITYGNDREEVKRRAQEWMGGNPDHYIVQPLTAEDDRVLIKLQFNS